MLGYDRHMPFIGEIRLVPFATAPEGWALCDGQSRPIRDHLPLYSLLAGKFGGDNETFALPNLDGRVLLGAGDNYDLGATEQTAEGPAAKERIGAVALNCIIATEGAYPPSSLSFDPIRGEIRMFAGDFAPRGWFFCDGRTLSMSEHPKLGGLLKTTFGGDANSFRLPDLAGRVPIGAGKKHALGKTAEVAISAKPNPDHRKAQAVTVSYIIAGDEADQYDDPYVGEIRIFAFDTMPDGFGPCLGFPIPISSNTELFSLIRTHFGGDGISRFELPDLVERAPLGHNTAHRVGESTGQLKERAKNGQPFCAVHFRIAMKGIYPPRA